MAYRGSEAYDFSLFEPQVVEQPKKAQPEKSNNSKRAKSSANAPVRKAQPKKPQAPIVRSVKKAVMEHTAEESRQIEHAVIPSSVIKAICFGVVCLCLVVVLLVINAQNDTLMNEINTVQAQIEVADGENVRLNAEMSSKMSTDKIEAYAEQVLGMVKAENYQINYIDLSEGDEIVVSGDKTVEEESEFAMKIKELFAYLF